MGRSRGKLIDLGNTAGRTLLTLPCVNSSTLVYINLWGPQEPRLCQGKQKIGLGQLHSRPPAATVADSLIRHPVTPF